MKFSKMFAGKVQFILDKILISIVKKDMAMSEVLNFVKMEYMMKT